MNIPKSTKEHFDKIKIILAEFIKEKVHEKYKEEFNELFLNLAEKLSRKRPSPLLTGNLNTWAASIVHAIGSANFMFDKSQEYYMPFSDISDYFGKSKSTISTKSKFLSDTFNISHFIHQWSLKKIIQDSPMSWMIMVDGLIVDARNCSLEIQTIAY